MNGFQIFVRLEENGPLHFRASHEGDCGEIDAFEAAYAVSQDHPGKNVLAHSQGKQVFVKSTDGEVPLAICSRGLSDGVGIGCTFVENELTRSRYATR